MSIFRCMIMCLVVLGPSWAWGKVTRIEVATRELYQNGKTFGETGAYERIRGKVYFAVDPLTKANRSIVDAELAPRNAQGLVEFSSDFEILVPQNRAKANGALLYDVNNRGNRVCLGMFNQGAEGFLMRQGYIIVWSGWIAEVLPGGERLILDAPVASEAGKPITGLVRAEFVSNTETARANIAHFGNQGSYPPTKRGLNNATLSRRLQERDPRVPIPRSQWKLHQKAVQVGGRKSALPLIEIEIANGIQPGWIYELIYEAEGPIVQGFGLAGIRDFLSFLKSETDNTNPLLENGRPVAKRAYGFGVSQSGRCLRQFLYDGFNADEEGRQVFEGLIPHVAGGGLGFFNHRFASPTRHNAQHDNHDFPADVFPFTYGEERDPFTKRHEGILTKAKAAGVVPKIMHIQTSSEYWHRAGSLVHTDPLGHRDAKIPPEVRIYTIGGAQHGPGSGQPKAGGFGQLPSNPTDYRPLLRGLLTALDQWVRQDVSPPPSIYPTLAEGTLTAWQAEKNDWQPLLGVKYPGVIHQPDFVDRGPLFLTKRRITIQPPKVIGQYVVKVPGYSKDNNERGCLLLPSVAVPVATLTSWNLRKPEIGAETELLSLAGGYVPLARTKEDRLKNKDPRRSLKERYKNFETYQQQFEKHITRLVQQRYVLEEDVPRLKRLALENKSQFGKASEK